MAIRRICVDEITDAAVDFAAAVTCTPSFTPTAPGTVCNMTITGVSLSPPNLSFTYDTEAQYFFGAASFVDFCVLLDQTGAMSVPEGSTICCSQTPGVFTFSTTCDPASISVGDTFVSWNVSASFTVNNLCSPTIICVDDTTCP